MSVLWGFPLALVALVALIVPVLLHLDRRRSLQILRFAAMRWIGSGHPPRRSLRLTEWLLLMLRMLLLATVAVWLAQPLLRGDWRAPQRWLAVVPGVTSTALSEAAVDIDRIVWLASSFPAINLPIEQAPLLAAQATASLLRELDAELAAADTLRVLLPPTLSGLDAEAIALTREIEWRIDANVAVPVYPEQPAEATPRLVAVRHEAATDTSTDVLRAAAAAATSATAFTLDVHFADIALPDAVDAVVWLGAAPSGAALARVEQGATLLHVTADPAIDGDWPGRTQRRGKGHVVTLAGPLQPARHPILQQPEFAVQLQHLLFGAPPAPSLGRAERVRPTLAPHVTLARDTDLRPWLAWLIGLLFLIERWVACGRRLRGAQ